MNEDERRGGVFHDMMMRHQPASYLVDNFFVFGDGDPVFMERRIGASFVLSCSQLLELAVDTDERR